MVRKKRRMKSELERGGKDTIQHARGWVTGVYSFRFWWEDTILYTRCTYLMKPDIFSRLHKPN